MSTQLDRWTGDFGREYTRRNVVDWRTRVEGFRQMIPPDVGGILEVGCNRGHNLRALREAFPDAFLVGTEPADYAYGIASGITREDGILTPIYNFSVYDLQQLVMIWMQIDLVFTSGVLIHIPPGRLDEALTQVHLAARRHILAIEYAGDDETVEYRGHNDMLWKRDYGKHYQRLFPSLKLIGTGENVQGFEGATYWLLKK